MLNHAMLFYCSLSKTTASVRDAPTPRATAVGMGLNLARAETVVQCIGATGLNKLYLMSSHDAFHNGVQGSANHYTRRDFEK